MNPREQRARLLVVLFLGFVCQAAFGHALGIRDVTPHIAMTMLLLECLFVGPNTGAALGFALGLLEGAYASRYVGSLLVTRSLVGFMVGAMEERIFRDNPAVGVVTVFVGSVLVEGCFFLFVPRIPVLPWAKFVFYQALYNAALALPLYFLLRRFLHRKMSTHRVL
jgi:rod shape-determining protein MreD